MVTRKKMPNIGNWIPPAIRKDMMRTGKKTYFTKQNKLNAKGKAVIRREVKLRCKARGIKFIPTKKKVRK